MSTQPAIYADELPMNISIDVLRCFFDKPPVQGVFKLHGDTYHCKELTHERHKHCQLLFLSGGIDPRQVAVFAPNPDNQTNGVDQYPEFIGTARLVHDFEDLNKINQPQTWEHGASRYMGSLHSC